MTEKQVKIALERLEPGLKQYLTIMELLPRTNISKDLDFQRRFNGFFKIRRNVEFRQAYYTFMEAHKGGCVPSFTDTVEYLYQFGKLEASFASKLLSILNPSLPVWDSIILQHLALRVPGYWVTKEERIRRADKTYNRIGQWYKDFLSSEGKKWIVMFDKRYPKRNLTPIKKIDLLLWQIR